MAKTQVWGQFTGGGSAEFQAPADGLIQVARDQQKLAAVTSPVAAAFSLLQEGWFPVSAVSKQQRKAKYQHCRCCIFGVVECFRGKSYIFRTGVTLLLVEGGLKWGALLDFLRSIANSTIFPARRVRIRPSGAKSLIHRQSGLQTTSSIGW